MTIGERIRARRKELNLSQSELAAKMGYKSKVAISNVETGKEDLTTTRVNKFADALCCTPMFLMGWTTEEKEAISKVRNALDQAPPREEISETDRHILFCYHLLSEEMRENVDDILNKAYKKHIERQKKKPEENSAS